MLIAIYIEALLVDEELADQVHDALMAGEIDEATAFLAWYLLAESLPAALYSSRTFPERSSIAKL